MAEFEAHDTSSVQMFWWGNIFLVKAILDPYHQSCLDFKGTIKLTHTLINFMIFPFFSFLENWMGKHIKTISENGVLHFIEWSIKILQVFLAPFLLQHRHKLYENFFVDYRLLKDLEVCVKVIYISKCWNKHSSIWLKFCVWKKKTRLFSNIYLSVLATLRLRMLNVWN